MDPQRYSRPWSRACLLLVAAMLGACAMNPGHPSRSPDWRLDTETTGRVRHAASLRGAGAPFSASRTVASNLGRLVPVLHTLLASAEMLHEMEERLVDCAKQAERQVNQSHFGDRSPTREECGEEVVVDGCPEPISLAMALGRKKHALAIACAGEVLAQLWPAPFSVEQRYRFYPNARFLETVSSAEEQRLIALGCTRELWRTIKPDLVLHGSTRLLDAVLILDFKFPCPDTNTPRWTVYKGKSAYAGSSQDRVYMDALGGMALIISPNGIIP